MSPMPGNSTRTMLIVSSRVSPLKPGAIRSMRIGVVSTQTSTIALSGEGHETEHGARDTIRGLPLAAGEKRGIDGNERRGQRAFTEKIDEELRDAEPGRERVRRRRQAEVVREHALPHEAGRRGCTECRCGDQHRRRGRRGRLGRSAGIRASQDRRLACPGRVCRSTSASGRS